MPSELDLTHWPTLPKYEYQVLFPRIAWEDRDSQLEDIIVRQVPRAGATLQAINVVEASRRLREAAKHDALMRNTVKNRKALKWLAEGLQKTQRALQELDPSALKTLDMSMPPDAQGRIKALFDIERGIETLADEIPNFPRALDGVSKSNKQTRFQARSLALRLHEAWLVISGDAPSLAFASNSIPAQGVPTPAFQKTLQMIGDHLEMGQIVQQQTFEARSMVEWLAREVGSSA